MAVPKKIWAAWFQGWDAAPDIVKMNLTRWATLNPGWEVELLDQADTDAMLADLNLPDDLAPQGRADLLRLKLLHERGGVWVDATLYPCWPLDRWLHDVFAAGFFLFRNLQDADLAPNWFLASEPGHPIVSAWWDDAVAYWSQRPEDPPYFWPQALWTHRRQNDPGFTALIDRIPVVDEQAMWTMAYFLQRGWVTAHQLRATCAVSPVQKLGWRGEGYPVAELAGLGLGPMP